MTLIIKCNAMASPTASGKLVAEAKRDDGYPQVGERVFVWTCETDGGDGLVACGAITAVGPGNDGGKRLTIDPDGRPIAFPLGKDDLRPYRDVTPGPAIVGLAKKLYLESRTRIVRLNADEERYLDDRFQK